MKELLITFPKIVDPRGNLTFFQYPDQIKFQIQRVYWTFGVPTESLRNGHALRSQNEIIIALNGSFEVVITSADGVLNRYFLNKANQGLFIPAKTWRHLEGFSTNSTALHVSDSKFEEQDYIRNFKEYNHFVKS